ncbi:hypothetical protein CDAR_578781 [Caerostris darwini]|uniref:Uncharacterized protein n=1 Tax=Caerostris darwini TaxID=1538125 RepID=A0AAV4UC28_9ARAC|nr:hypothetical protein CDAR_578781 [Caerostris darwini]
MRGRQSLKRNHSDDVLFCGIRDSEFRRSGWRGRGAPKGTCPKLFHLVEQFSLFFLSIESIWAKQTEKHFDLFISTAETAPPANDNDVRHERDRKQRGYSVTEIQSQGVISITAPLSHLPQKAVTYLSPQGWPTLAADCLLFFCCEEDASGKNNLSSDAQSGGIGYILAANGFNCLFTLVDAFRHLKESPLGKGEGGQPFLE